MYPQGIVITEEKLMHPQGIVITGEELHVPSGYCNHRRGNTCTLRVL